MAVLCFYGLQGGAWSTFGQSFGLITVFILVYESLAQAFSSLGVATGMILYMFVVDQGNTFNGVFTPIDKTEYPFKFMSFSTPSRQLVASFTYLQCVHAHACMCDRLSVPTSGSSAWPPPHFVLSSRAHAHLQAATPAFLLYLRPLATV